MKKDSVSYFPRNFKKIFRTAILSNTSEHYFCQSIHEIYGISHRYSEGAIENFLYKKAILKNLARFTGKQLCQGLFFNKVAGLESTLLKYRLRHRCFLVNFAKFLKVPQNISERLLLAFKKSKLSCKLSNNTTLSYNRFIIIQKCKQKQKNKKNAKPCAKTM